MNFLLKLFAVLCIFLFVVVPMYIKHETYHPSKDYQNVTTHYEDVYFTTSDGIKINGWYSPPRYRNITVIFCHGNGGNLSYYQDIFSKLKQKGFGILAIDYRGYGKSEGKPGEKGLYEDLRTGIKFLNDEKKTPKKNIVLWGLSLGGAVVSQVASEDVGYRGVILHSTFTNLKAMVGNIIAASMPQLGENVSILTNIIPMFEKYDTKSRIELIKSPILITHSTPDDVVPVEMSRELAKLTPKAQVFISEEGGHNDYDWLYTKLFRYLELLERTPVH